MNAPSLSAAPLNAPGLSADVIAGSTTGATAIDTAVIDTTVIDIRGLAFGYGNEGGDGDAGNQGATTTVVLEELTLALARGGFLAVVGPSGVGKSTLLRVIAGLSRPLAGTVSVTAQPTATQRPVAMVFQEARLLPWRRVMSNIEFGLEGLVPDRAERRRRARNALELVGLSGQERKWPHQLSGGQRQRVGLARALAVEPMLLLLDEPFSALDAITRQSLQDELLRIWRETGTSILLVTHDLDEAVYLADRVILLDGKPARVSQDLAIDLPRPRRREAPAFGESVRVIRDAMSQGYVDGDGI